ncbi:hypothetical protein [Nocardia brasiliensis]|uniref:hypothetical protein n=1 Tax=Nocardia brasiliensis TaxID=37326 RepID=UPI003CC90F93
MFWLAAVRDAFSNRIVGWKCSDRCDTELVLGALEYAVWVRDVRDGSWSIIPTAARPTRQFVSPIGWQTTESRSRWDRLATATTTRSWRTSSPRRRPNWSTGTPGTQGKDAENALFSSIDGWYNTQRIQKKLRWRSPDEYEASYHHRVPAGTR